MSATDRKMKMAELRIENNYLRDERNAYVRTNSELLLECDALRAENERLRQALEEIANHCRPQRGGEEMALDWIEHEAREALEVKG